MNGLNVKINLPKDLKKYVVRGVLKRVIPCALMFAFFVFVLINYGDEMFSIKQTAIKFLLYFVVILLPFVITGVPIKLIDKSWCGEIVEINVKSVTDSYTVGGRPWPYTRNVIKLKIRKENGKFIVKDAKSFGVKEPKGFDYKGNDYYVSGKIENFVDDYQVGDVAFHFYGIPELLIVSKRRLEYSTCIICGVKNPTYREDCYSCGHSLFINEELKLAVYHDEIE